jgi:hypothetical protein
MSYAQYDPTKRDIKPRTWEKYYAVADAWLSNGYNSAEAYQSVYPNCKDRKTAMDNFCHIKRIPEIAEYIAEQRQAAFDAKCIDLTRVTEEIAKMAFCPDGDKYIPASVKAKALEMLQKALREDVKTQQQAKEEITIGLEEDEDEDSSEEESI